MPDAMRCGLCGKQLAADFAFCPYCGGTCRPAGPAKGTAEKQDAPAPRRSAPTPKHVAVVDAFDREYATLRAQRETAPPRRQWNVTIWFYVAFTLLTVGVLGAMFIVFHNMAVQMTHR
jgi:hypothetical protein